MDFVLGDMEVAIEVKGGAPVHDGAMAGLRALRDHHRVRRSVVVCLERQPRVAGGIDVLPRTMFLDELWGGALVG